MKSFGQIAALILTKGPYLWCHKVCHKVFDSFKNFDTQILTLAVKTCVKVNYVLVK